MNEMLKPEAVMVETNGKVPAAAVTEARERIAALSRFTGRPILYARVVLGDSPARDPEERCRARAVLDVNGHALYAEARAETMYGAIAGVQQRLRGGLERLAGRHSRKHTQRPPRREPERAREDTRQPRVPV
ncbi:HPF/RaiA family ribosome-associated protein [Sphaerimonospora sp. CA-214678]|uniref:HPF/RaiA family ribosome-associated protein n=1 Tax=Sphaerimonospora sp. CA-214678 TaxID=3240029 RepID=UPI003D8EEA21